VTRMCAGIVGGKARLYVATCARGGHNGESPSDSSSSLGLVSYPSFNSFKTSTRGTLSLNVLSTAS
jgi:hypothetical protein